MYRKMLQIVCHAKFLQITNVIVESEPFLEKGSNQEVFNVCFDYYSNIIVSMETKDGAIVTISLDQYL